LPTGLPCFFRETQELVFDAHDKAFQFYGGVCRRGIYDNMKTAVEAIFVGKARRYNRRFLQMCSHHLIEPVACTPASGWENGQVENQVGNLRDQMFRPKPRVKSLAELNAWLEDSASPTPNEPSIQSSRIGPSGTCSKKNVPA
jgi:transposase